MRKSRFSEEQILGILKEGDAGVERGGVDEAPRNQPCDVLPVAIEVRGGDAVGASSDEGAGTGEHEAGAMYAHLALENAAIKDVLQRKL
jgi:putative transposase